MGEGVLHCIDCRSTSTNTLGLGGYSYLRKEWIQLSSVIYIRHEYFGGKSEQMAPYQKLLAHLNPLEVMCTYI